MTPKRTFAVAHLNHEHALRQLCASSTDEQIDAIPDLREWYTWDTYWMGLSVEERKAILDKEWRYD